MQTFLSATPRCKNRLARPQIGQTLATALAVLWSTTACYSLSGAQPKNPFVEPTRREQPQPVVEERVILLQPPSVEVSHSHVIPAHATDSPAAALQLAAKWRTNLLMRSMKDESAEKTTAPNPTSDLEEIAVPETNEPIADSAADAETEQERACYSAPPLSTVIADIRLPAGKLPTDAFIACSEKNPPVADRRASGGWMMFEHHWSATCMRHRPLYFEEVNAERYGYTPSYLFQPVISAAHFFATVPAMPYKMAVDCPRDCIYTLGHYRPGSCNPWRRNRLPLKLDASAVEVGAVAGLILLVP